MVKFLISLVVRNCLVLIVLAIPLSQAVFAQNNTDFERWFERVLRPEARKAGVRKATLDAVLHGLQPELSNVGARTKDQPEFKAPAAYFREGGLKGRAKVGREFAKRFANELDAARSRTGVPARIILAIWARESDFGAFTLKRNALDVLAGRAFFGPRKEFFLNELIAALKIVQAGIAPAHLRSSGAGALGQPQFMPSSYLRYARDGNSDGQIDIWDSKPDTIASIAAFLSAQGWQAGRDWGFEVTLPQDFDCAFEGPDQSKLIRDWVALGIKRVNGRAFPSHEINQTASLLLPAGTNGPAFLVTPNFYVLKRYNESDLYALYVGHLGDRIEFGIPAFRGRWGQTDELLRSEIMRMQRKLVEFGFDVGGVDGLVGYKTRRAIGAWQKMNGHKSTCFPNKATVQRIIAD